MVSSRSPIGHGVLTAPDGGRVRELLEGAAFRAFRSPHTTLTARLSAGGKRAMRASERAARTTRCICSLPPADSARLGTALLGQFYQMI